MVGKQFHFTMAEKIKLKFVWDFAWMPSPDLMVLRKVDHVDLSHHQPGNSCPRWKRSEVSTKSLTHWLRVRAGCFRITWAKLWQSRINMASSRRHFVWFQLIFGDVHENQNSFLLDRHIWYMSICRLRTGHATAFQSLSGWLEVPRTTSYLQIHFFPTC